MADYADAADELPASLVRNGYLTQLVWGLGLRVQGIGFRVLRVWGFGFRV